MSSLRGDDYPSYAEDAAYSRGLSDARSRIESALPEIEREARQLKHRPVRRKSWGNDVVACAEAECYWNEESDGPFESYGVHAQLIEMARSFLADVKKPAPAEER